MQMFASFSIKSPPPHSTRLGIALTQSLRLFVLGATAGACLSTSLRAQVPTAPAALDPTKKSVPAEIVPPEPAVAPVSKAPMETPAPLSPGTKAALESAESTGNRAVDALSEGELDQVITLIRQHYISPKALTDAAVKRATVQGLMERLGASASLIIPGTQEVAETSAFRSETIAKVTGYLRLGGFGKTHLAELDKALAGFAEAKLTSLILDLRATPAGGDFEQAAEVCRRFCPKGKILFTLKRPEEKQAEIFTTKEEPRFAGLLTVLTDAQTAGSAEVVAGALRTLTGAVVIGQKTRGAAAEFTEFPLGGGRLLRLAVAEVLLPGDVSVVPEGVKPDVPVEVSSEDEAAVLALELEHGVGPYILETERTRLNEAALVAGINPELDAAQAAQTTRGAKTRPALHDPILQRALDLITSVAIFQVPAKK